MSLAVNLESSLDDVDYWVKRLQAIIYCQMKRAKFFICPKREKIDTRMWKKQKE